MLRVISAIAVITIHTSGTYKGAITSESTFGVLYTVHIPEILLYNTLSRFAVPCFVMLSGAFLLANEGNAAYKKFYRKTFGKLGIPMLIFSLLYFIYGELRAILAIFIKHRDISRAFSPIKNLLIGCPVVPMWYLYTMLGVYITIPVLVRLKRDIGEAAFRKLAWIMFFAAGISGWTSDFVLQWSVAKSACYLGYFMLGYVLRTYAGEKNSKRGILFICCGLIAEVLLTVIQYKHTMLGLADADEKYSLVGNFNPLVLLASILIFTGFSKIKVQSRVVERVAKASFLIYLFHSGVLGLIQDGVKFLWGASADCRIVIPVSILLVFVVSYGLSLLYQKIWALADKDGRITNRLCALVGLA